MHEHLIKNGMYFIRREKVVWLDRMYMGRVVPMLRDCRKI